MNSDPLANSKVVITVRVLADSSRRDDRSVLVAVAAEGEAPRMEKGQFADLSVIVDRLWAGHELSAVVEPATAVATGRGEELAAVESLYSDEFF